MAIPAGTDIFTDTGWKPIEDVAGKDKVLVKNFLGEAMFVQPYALKRIKYDGKLVRLYHKFTSIELTPDQNMIYYHDDGHRLRKSTAKEYTISKYHYISSNFRYSPDKWPKSVVVKTPDLPGPNTKKVSPYDWHTLAGYILARGSYHSRSKTLLIRANKEEQVILCDILDRYGLAWSLTYTGNEYTNLVRVSDKSNLSRKARFMFGNKKGEMGIPDSMIFDNRKENILALVNTIDRLTGIKKGNMTGNSKKLIKSLEKTCTLWRIPYKLSWTARAGEYRGRGPLTKDRWDFKIIDKFNNFYPRKRKEVQFTGNVYELDLLDGEVYVKNKGRPVWIPPK